jgi:RNA polymerase sigma-70 factor (ECF subfamily)
MYSNQASSSVNRFALSRCPSVVPQIPDEVLLDLIADGDKQALNTFYTRHHRMVCAFIRRFVRDDSTAEESANEVFLDVWRNAQRFQGKSKVVTWLLGIARYKAISSIRRRSELQLDDTAAAVLEDPSDGPAVTMDKQARKTVLHDCVAKLAPPHQQVIDLIYYQEKKIEEAAEFLNIPVNTVKTRMFYARNRLGKLLTESGVDEAWVAL